MKDIVLAVLKQNRENFVSGEELSQLLKVSRTAVWKYINALRDEGYKIESSPKRGYRLTSVPDLLTPMEIGEGLQTDFMGRTIFYYPEVDSTNILARELAADDAVEGVLVVADSQIAGRGRMGRFWSSPVGGIWLSMILRPQIPSFQVSLITLLAAVAAVEATREVCGLTPFIKWPNDLLVGQKKLAGILTEVSAEIDRVRYLVVGVGFNANVPADVFPADLQQAATSILAETGKRVERVAWVRSFLTQFEQHYTKAVTVGFSEVLTLWRSYSGTLGQQVTVHLAGESIKGTAVDIDEQGALLVETKDGLKKCWAGEVSLNQAIKG